MNIPPLIRVKLPGIPQQQGSKTRNRYGAIYETNKELESWRADAIHTMQQTYTGSKITGAVSIDATFLFPRPAAHYGSGRNRGKVKPNAPLMKITAPDLDKLERALGDVLTQAGIIQDDRQIVHWDCRKCFTQLAPGTEVWIWESEP
jgi:Holliday junction resolvase RusA-like endonuclease